CYYIGGFDSLPHRTYGCKFLLKESVWYLDCQFLPFQTRETGFLTGPVVAKVSRKDNYICKKKERKCMFFREAVLS
ncbi:hypothetical protein NPIL_549811, partial [Nephila pilipes]